MVYKHVCNIFLTLEFSIVCRIGLDLMMIFSSPAHRRILVFLLAIICVYLFVIRQPLNVYSVDSFFKPPMSDATKAVLRRTLGALVNVLDRINATYFMASGTLLGSYRHHGFIPWDDDVDLIVSTADKARVYDALLAIAPHYVVHKIQHLTLKPMHWKLFSTTGTSKVPLRPYQWPSVDVLFFDEDDHNVWNESPWFVDERWPKSAIFPLVRRPFDGLWLPAPCDTAAVLAVNFDIDKCASRTKCHSYDVPFLTSIVVPCDNLRMSFPFVNRSSLSPTGISASGLRSKSQNRFGKNNGVVESLTIADRTLQTITVQSKCSAK